MRKLLIATVLFGLVSVLSADGVVVPAVQTDAGMVGFVMTYHNVRIVIDEGIAHVSIEEEFKNISESLLEAVYLFPVPRNAVISDFKMKVGDDIFSGEVLSAEQARSIYLEIVSAMRDPALLEYVGSGLIRLSVFPFEPGEKRTFSLNYSQPLELVGNAYSFTYPLKIESLLSEPIGRVSIVVEVSDDIAEVFSPSHPFRLMDNDGYESYIYEAKNLRPNSDVTLVLSTGGTEIPSSMVTHWDSTLNHGYFLLSLVPKIEEATVIPKDVVFVLDISGSMYGAKIEQARKALEQTLQMLRDEDRFALVTFDGNVYNLTRELLPAYQKTEWVSRVREIQAGGLTNIYDALEVGLSVFDGTEGRFRVLLFLTDGEPTAGITETGRIVNDITSVAREKGVHIFSFGIGTSVVAELLDRLVQENAGRVSYIVEGETIEAKVADLYRSIETPALENVTVNLSGIPTISITPEGPYTLFSGSALRLSGIFLEGGELRVRVEGERSGEHYTYIYRFDIDQLQENVFVSRIWAQRRIAQLANRYRYEQGLSEEARKEISDEIIALSKRFNIINEFTSFLIAPEVQNISRSFSDSFDLASDGIGSVMAAKSVAEMEQDAITGVVATDLRFIGQEIFGLVDGIWTHDHPGINELEEVKVEVFSEAYFKLVEIDPWIMEVCALGSRVKFVFNDTLFDIGDEGIGSHEELIEVLN